MADQTMTDEFLFAGYQQRNLAHSPISNPFSSVISLQLCRVDKISTDVCLQFQRCVHTLRPSLSSPAFLSIQRDGVARPHQGNSR